MRILLFMLAIFVLTVGVGTPAEAQNYPWCATRIIGTVNQSWSEVGLRQEPGQIIPDMAQPA
jgi:hypothetical protein